MLDTLLKKCSENERVLIVLIVGLFALVSSAIFAVVISAHHNYVYNYNSKVTYEVDDVYVQDSGEWDACSVEYTYDELENTADNDTVAVIGK